MSSDCSWDLSFSQWTRWGDFLPQTLLDMEITELHAYVSRTVVKVNKFASHPQPFQHVHNFAHMSNSIQCYKTFASPGLCWVFVYISCMKKHCQLLWISPKNWHENLYCLKIATRTFTKFWPLTNKQHKYPQNDLCHFKLPWHWPTFYIKAHRNYLCLFNSPW